MRFLAAKVFLLTVAASVFGATEYTGDGAWVSKLEVQRWLINRARYAPEQEADHFGLVNSTTGGTPDYDVCEDVSGVNDFGTTTNQWAPWLVSLPPLAPNALLTTAAATHCKDMAEQDAFQHASPSSNYYPIDSDPAYRTDAEGYVNNIIGFYENISWGARGSGGSYPSYGRTSEDCHQGLFVDSTAANRGHRQAILNSNAREIGIGTYLTNSFDGTYWTEEYFCQDFQRTYGNHFFTGTIFYDSNGDKAYSDGEGIANVEVRLWDGGVEGTYYDKSVSCGSFAIPISDHTDGNEISVQLVNKTGGPVTISMPMGWGTLGEISLTNNEAYTYGTFTQPNTDANVGFRETDPVVEVTDADVVIGNMDLTFPAFKGATYVVKHCTDLVSGSWSNLTQVTATGSVHTVTDPGMGAAPAKYYRTFLVRE